MRATGTARLTTALVATIALQSAVPPFATDMYTPAFPQVTADLGTDAGLVGLTLTTFFLGMGLGQLLGGPVSDRLGRKGPLIAGGVLCALGAIGCALAPAIGPLVAFRILQGFGGGVAAAVGRAVVIDVAAGDQLARAMSILMSLGGLAPMVAPVLGGVVLSAGGTWRMVFWCLTGLAALMVVTAATVVPETLPRERRGASSNVLAGFGTLARRRSFVGYTLTGALSGFTMMAYIANASYVLQSQKGMAPLTYSLFFASTALAQVLLSLVNVRLVGRVPTRHLIATGLAASVVAVAGLAVGVGFLGTPLLLTCAGFGVLMASQAFVFGNSAALGAADVRHVAGSAAALQGVTQSIAMAVSSPLASSGGAESAAPMIAVMLVGVTAAVLAFTVLARSQPARPATTRRT